jgi:PAS domain S-box-containing protein
MTARIALVYCSEAETDSVRMRLGETSEVVAVEIDALPPIVDERFDFVVVGAFAARRRATLPVIREKLGAVPFVLLVGSDDEAPPIDDADVLTLGEMRRLPHIIRRETRLREIEKLLQRGERRYRELTENANEGLWIVDAGGITTFVNRKMAALFGCAAASVIGAPMAQFVDEEWRAVAQESLMRRRMGIAETHDLRLRRANGTTFFATVSSRPIYDEQGSYAGALSLVIDITARREVEEALLRRETELSIAHELAHLGSWEWDFETNRIIGSRELFRLLGLGDRAGALELDEWLTIVHRDDVPALRQALDDAAREGREFEHEYRLRGASERIIHSRGRLIADAGGVPRRMIGMAQDVTQRTEVERALEQEKRLSSLGHLAASVAHEFNNVLMSIMPFAELLKRRAPDDDGTAIAARHIFQAIRRGRQISQEILRFAQPAALQVTNVDIREWLHELRRESSALVGSKYRVRAAAASGGPLHARADRAALNRVATNLVLNARDAMPDGGTIAIEARQSESSIEIVVHDDGSGIPPGIINRIFDPLFTTKPGGTGLGLSVAYASMQQMGGTLKAESREGEGSDFTIVLRVGERPAGHGIRSLLADEGFDVRLVTRGAEADDAVAAFEPDVVVLDVNLPDMSGLEVLAKIRASRPSMPVILSTGHADAEALDAIRKLRVPALMKPYRIADLLALLERSW